MMKMPEFTTIGGAAKVSGRTANGLSVGILEAVSLKANAHIFENGVDSEKAVEPLAKYLVGRFQKDFDRGNTILGGIVTHTHRAIRDEHLHFLGRDALSVGIDFTKFWKDRKYFLEFKTTAHILAEIRRPSGAADRPARYYQRPEAARPIPKHPYERTGRYFVIAVEQILAAKKWSYVRPDLSSMTWVL